MTFFSQLDAVRDRHDVLRHPFYQRWSAGELKRDELAVYAGEYHHAVVGLAEGTAATAAAADGPELRAELDRHAAQEADHVSLWGRFAEAVGGTPAAEPAPESLACRAAWAGSEGRSLLEGLVALYAIESGQPQISATKRAGLVEHARYGVADGAGTAYFTLHETLDVEHAAAGRERIAERLDGADADALLAEAERVLRANWELLDGVERLNGRG